MTQMTDYPLILHGTRSLDGREITLFPPHPFVVTAAAYLSPASSILDLGSHNGRNGLYLAEQGHHVTSIDSNEAYIEEGKQLAKTIGGLALENNVFVNRNMLEIAYTEEFDAVIATHSLYEIARSRIPDVLNRIQTATKPGGINVHRAYIGTEEDQQKVLPKTLLGVHQLRDMYNSIGWRNLYARENPEPLREHEESGKYLFSGTAELISQKPAISSGA